MKVKTCIKHQQINLFNLEYFQHYQFYKTNKKINKNQK